MSNPLIMVFVRNPELGRVKTRLAKSIGDQAALELQKLVARLPEKQRIVFNMKYFDDMPYEMISKVLDTSIGALKASYHHAVKKIKTELNDRL